MNRRRRLWSLAAHGLMLPAAALFFLTILARPASASPRSTGHEEWVRLDSTGRWAWGVEQSTAVWHGADHFVWTVAIAPEPAQIEGRMVDYVIVLHRFHCADETMQVQALAAYGRSALGKFALTRPDAVAIPVNDHVMEIVCNLGMGQRLSDTEAPARDLGDFVEGVTRPSTLWDELWLRRHRAPQ